jgi:hypothetical protein
MMRLRIATIWRKLPVKVFKLPAGRLLFLLVLGLFGSITVQAQGEGEIERVEVEIIKNREVSVPQAARNFEKIPPRPVEPIKPQISYQFKNLSFNVPDYNPVIRPLRLKTESISKIYGNYISAGLGNYASPYAEAYFTNKRNKNKSYGMKFFHRSFMNGPVDDKNSASGHTELRLFGKTMNNNMAIGGFANYENTAGYFYGYLPRSITDRSTIRQDYNIVSVGGELENSKLSNFSYNFRAGYSYLLDHYSANEGEVNLNFMSQYKIDAKKKVIVNSDYFMITRKDALINPKARHIFKVKPAYQFTPIDDLILTAGANIVVENDTIGNQNGFHIYPNLGSSYQLSPSVEWYAGLTGDVDKVSLHSLSRENLWVNANIAIFNTNRTAEFLTGLKGKVSGKVSFGTGLSFASLKNLYYYQSGTGNLRSKFDVVYDNGSTQRANFFGELGYTNQSVKLNVRGDYYSYATSIANQITHQNNFEKTALNRPTYRFTVNSSFNIYDKLLLSADFIAQGGIKALDLDSKNMITLNAAADLNFKANYFVSKQFSIFLNFNNVLSSNYQLYWNYPVRGFQVMGGASWNF